MTNSSLNLTSLEFNLVDLNGTNGFTVSSVYDSGIGYAISGAGDVNNDGFDDFIIGGPSFGSRTGHSYVVFGKAAGFDALFKLESANGLNLDGSNGFKIGALEYRGFAGASVSSADINNDGFSDLIVGAPGALSAINSNDLSGQTYVIYGKSEGFSASVRADGINGFVIDGIHPGDSLGTSASSAGDVNGDGFDDLIIGAPAPRYDYRSRDFLGESYIIFGKADGFNANFSPSELDGTNGFTFRDDEFHYLGTCVSSAGDINGDGFDDVVVSARGSQASYVVFGKAGGFAASLSPSQLDGVNGFALNGFVPNGWGSSFENVYPVSGGGDINNDGLDDLIVGNYVVLGKTGGFSASLDLTNLNGNDGFAISGITSQTYGFSISDAGDINGDGFDDLIIGEPFADPNGYLNAGKSYVVFGKADGFGASLNLADLNGHDGFIINGFNLRNGDPFYSSTSSFSVSGAGDINGDGIDDLAIGAPGAYTSVNYSGYTSSTRTGAGYIVFGNAAPELDLNGNGGGIDFIATFEGSAVAVVDADLSLGDRNSATLKQAIAQISNPLDGANEFLTANTSGTNITATYSAGILTLSGTDTVSNYEQVLRTITYSNAAPIPTATNRLIEFVVDDGAGFSNASLTARTIVTLTTGKTNTPPSAVNDVVVLDEDTVAILDVLANDSDVDGDIPALSLVTAPSYGAAVVNDNGTPSDFSDDFINYTPVTNFNGNDQLTYQLDDGKGGVSMATVSLTITPLNDAPVAANDAFTTDENTPVTISTAALLSNDTDIDGDNLTITAATQPGNGSLVANSNGTYIYTPTVGYFGTDSFTYTVSDGNGGTSTATVNLTINSLFNTIQGTSKSETLIGTDRRDKILGLDGNDTLQGLGANDLLNGGRGNDQLDGGTGNDTLEGGVGSDTYIVDSRGDTIIERANAGTDTVKVSFSWVLENHLENLTLTGSVAIDGTGNSLKNKLAGNAGANTLTGGEGNDIVKGGSGNDVLLGNAGNDTLLGNNDNDALTGGSGFDRLTGGSGQDGFYLTETRTGEYDTITDFKSGDDTLYVSRSELGLDQPLGVLAPSLLVLGSSATQGSDRFIYDRNTGNLFFDADGIGGVSQVRVAKLSNKATLTSNDFVVIT